MDINALSLPPVLCLPSEDCKEFFIVLETQTGGPPQPRRAIDRENQCIFPGLGPPLGVALPLAHSMDKQMVLTLPMVPGLPLKCTALHPLKCSCSQGVTAAQKTPPESTNYLYPSSPNSCCDPAHYLFSLHLLTGLEAP